MKLDTILSVLEKERLSYVASDSVIMGAIKKVILSSVYYDGTLHKDAEPEPLKNFCLAIATEPKITREELGGKILASLAGVQLLEAGFRELEKFKVVETQPKEIKNQAR